MNLCLLQDSLPQSCCLSSSCPPHLSRPLQWRHNDYDGVSNHQPHDCSLNHLFRCRSKKTSKLPVTGLCVGNSPGPVNSPHKGPLTQKMFPFDDVIMINFDHMGITVTPQIIHDRHTDCIDICSSSAWRQWLVRKNYSPKVLHVIFICILCMG